MGDAVGDTVGWAPGDVLAGRYELVGPVSSGGMGRVWRARDPVLGRDVALKEILVPPGDQDARDELVRRVLREARAAAAVRHPGLVTVYDVVTDPRGNPVVVMEFLDGPSLAAVLREKGPLPAAEAADLAGHLLDALEAAHEHGVVHRDIKPANIILDRGRPVVVDFGIARLDDPRLTRLTRTDVVIGTLTYMAPEQIRGGEPNPGWDLWALGATLYELVEGHPPFSAPTQAGLMYAVLEQPVPPARRSGRLRRLLTALLTRTPGDRPGAAAARALLRSCAAAVAFAPAPLDVPAHQGWVDLAFCHDSRLLAVADTAALTIWDAERGERVAVTPCSSERPVPELAASPTGTQLALRGDDRICLFDACTSRELHVLDHSGGQVFAYSPRGDRLAAATSTLDPSTPTRLRVWDTRSGALVWSEELRHNVADIRHSPDGSLLAVASWAYGQLEIRDALTGSLVLHRQLGIWGTARPLVFAPDGRTFVTGIGDPELLLWDTAKGEVLSRYRPPEGTRVMFTRAPHGVCFSPDGRLLAAGYDAGVCLWDTTTGDLLLAYNGYHVTSCAPVFSPDSRLLAADMGATVRVWDTDDPGHWLDLAYDGYPSSLAMAPDGSRIALAAKDGTVRIWTRKA